MKTLLRIDASIRLAGSHTRELTRYFEKTWLMEHPGGQVIRRCLTTAPIPHLTQEAFDEFQSADEHAVVHPLSTILVNELKCADHLLIGSPLYNLSLPSPLKAYFDHTVRLGSTFESNNGRYRGLLAGKSATLITARAGYRSPDYSDDFQKEYLKQILAFIGITQVKIVALEGMGEDQKAQEQSLACAQRQIDRILQPSSVPMWLGEFTDIDKQEIDHLRVSQAEAIVAGDARAYASLCTEDIQLLIPGNDLISGQEDFLNAESALFKNASFDSFCKQPVSVQRSGDLAVEVGRQMIEMQHRKMTKGVFSTYQKYTHVYRRADNGWRIAVLMSNPSE